MSGPTEVLNGGPNVIEVPADTWGPVPMRWELVQAGDIILGRDGTPWQVVDKTPLEGDEVLPTVQRGRDTFEKPTPGAQLVNVLIPLVDRQAVLNLREAGITGRLIERTAS